MQIVLSESVFEETLSVYNLYSPIYGHHLRRIIEDSWAKKIGLNVGWKWCGMGELCVLIVGYLCGCLTWSFGPLFLAQVYLWLWTKVLLTSLSFCITNFGKTTFIITRGSHTLASDHGGSHDNQWFPSVV